MNKQAILYKTAVLVCDGGRYLSDEDAADKIYDLITKHNCQEAVEAIKEANPDNSHTRCKIIRAVEKRLGGGE